MKEKRAYFGTPTFLEIILETAASRAALMG
jgi:hypothetical protein